MLTFDETGNNTDYSLVFADLGPDFNTPRLRIFKSLEQTKFIPLTGIPSFVIKLQQSTTNKVPLLAVAAQDTIFIYRNFKAYHRWKLPRPNQGQGSDLELATFQSEEEQI